MGSKVTTRDPDDRSEIHRIAEDETFIDLMRVAREDAVIGQRLRGLLRLDDFNRRSLLNTWIQEAKLRGAPADFVQALEYLRIDEVAGQARNLLEESAGE